MRLMGTTVVVVVAAAAVAGGYALRVANEPDRAEIETVPIETTPVVMTDLVEFETLSGTLGYAGARELRSGVVGTVTGLPDEASRIERGSVAFEVDGLPVIVLLGERPAWRPLNEGVDDGADVLQLEENLSALGFGPDGWEPDEEFDGDTVSAIEDWREQTGLPESDAVELGRVVFVDEPLRVGALSVVVGQPVVIGTPIYEATTFDQEVVIQLDPNDGDLVSVGAIVTVILPDDTHVAGEITDVGRVVRPNGPEPGSPGVVEVKVSLAEPAVELDQAPVDVEIESDRASGVLAVPVRALLSLSDGGYAVEVGDRLIAVETGDFAGGLVEVSGALSPGDLVVVPK